MLDLKKKSARRRWTNGIATVILGASALFLGLLVLRVFYFLLSEG